MYVVNTCEFLLGDVTASDPCEERLVVSAWVGGRASERASESCGARRVTA